MIIWSGKAIIRLFAMLFVSVQIGAIINPSASADEYKKFVCEQQCRKECKERADGCRDEIDKTCKAAKWLGYKIYCDLRKKDCGRSQKFCNLVGCMNAGGGGGSCTPKGPWGEPHYITLDGAYFDFQGAGEFTLLESSARELVIQTRLEPLGGRVSVITAVAVSSGGRRVGVYARDREERLWIDGAPAPLPQGEVMEDDDGLTIFLTEQDIYAIGLPDGTGVRVALKSGRMDVGVSPSEGVADFIGMMGNANGDPLDDLMSRGGKLISRDELDGEGAYDKLYRVYGDSWRITDETSLFDYIDGNSTATFTDTDFPAEIVRMSSLDQEARDVARKVCRDTGTEEGVALEACVFDVTVSGDVSFATESYGKNGSVPSTATTAVPMISTVVSKPSGPATPADSPSTLGDPENTFAETGVRLSHPGVLTPGETFTVIWTQDGRFERPEWIDMVEAGETRINAMSVGGNYRRTSGEGGELAMRAPQEEGLYDIRFVARVDGSREVIALSRIEVTAR